MKPHLSRLKQKEVKNEKVKGERERENYHTIEPFNSWVETQKLRSIISTSKFIAVLSMTAKKWDQLRCLAVVSGYEKCDTPTKWNLIHSPVREKNEIIKCCKKVDELGQYNFK